MGKACRGDQCPKKIFQLLKKAKRFLVASLVEWNTQERQPIGKITKDDCVKGGNIHTHQLKVRHTCIKPHSIPALSAAPSFMFAHNQYRQNYARPRNERENEKSTIFVKMPLTRNSIYHIKAISLSSFAVCFQRV